MEWVGVDRIFTSVRLVVATLALAYLFISPSPSLLPNTSNANASPKSRKRTILQTYILIYALRFLATLVLGQLDVGGVHLVGVACAWVGHTTMRTQWTSL